MRWVHIVGDTGFTGRVRLLEDEDHEKEDA